MSRRCLTCEKLRFSTYYDSNGFLDGNYLTKSGMKQTHKLSDSCQCFPLYCFHKYSLTCYLLTNKLCILLAIQEYTGYNQQRPGALLYSGVPLLVSYIYTTFWYKSRSQPLSALLKFSFCSHGDIFIPNCSILSQTSIPSVKSLNISASFPDVKLHWKMFRQENF